MWGCDRMCIFVIICLANVGKVYRQSKSPSLLRNLVPAPGEGIYFAAKSGRMCAKTIVKNSKQGARMIDEVSWSQGNWRIRFEDDEGRWYDSLSDGMNEVVISAGHMEASTPVLDVCCLMSCCLWCFGFLVLITAEIQLYSDLIRAFCNKQSSRWLWRMDPSYFLSTVSVLKTCSRKNWSRVPPNLETFFRGRSYGAFARMGWQVWTHLFGTLDEHLGQLRKENIVSHDGISLDQNICCRLLLTKKSVARSSWLSQ